MQSTMELQSRLRDAATASAADYRRFVHELVAADELPPGHELAERCRAFGRSTDELQHDVAFAARLRDAVAGIERAGELRGQLRGLQATTDSARGKRRELQARIDAEKAAIDAKYSDEVSAADAAVAVAFGQHADADREAKQLFEQAAAAFRDVPRPDLDLVRAPFRVRAEQLQRELAQLGEQSRRFDRSIGVTRRDRVGAVEKLRSELRSLDEALECATFEDDRRRLENDRERVARQLEARESMTKRENELFAQANELRRLADEAAERHRHDWRVIPLPSESKGGA